MRRSVGFLMVVTLLLVFSPSANATRTWASGNVGNWTDTANWSGGVLPSSSETAQINGNCTLNANETIGQLLMGAAATDRPVLNITTGANLNIGKNSAELFSLGKFAGITSVVNHSAGTVRVFRPDGANTGETRLVTSGTTLATVTYNLSGTGVLDTEILTKYNKSATGATFNATGGTLVIRNQINKFGLISEGYGFNQGTCKLELGQIDTVSSTILVGNATNAMDYTAGTGAILNIDIDGPGSNDKVTQYGSIANLAGATMQVDLLDGFTPTVNSFFDVWRVDSLINSVVTVGGGAGSGAVVGLPTGWSASWIDTNADTTTDTLRLTYTPEPTTDRKSVV